MTLKMKNILFISCILIVFLLLWSLTLFADVPDGMAGFGESTAISPDDETLVFSYYHDGDAALYTVPTDGGEATLIAQPEEGASYVNPVFSPDGNMIAFIKQWQEEDQPYGELMLMGAHSGEKRALTSGYNLITEAVFSPDGGSLYFLQAGIFQNYSEIARERPHDFDIYNIDLSTNETEQITNKAAYDMSSLDVTPNGKALMYRSYEDSDRIIFLSLENNRETAPVPIFEVASDAPILSSPALSPDGEQVAFTDVATLDENGTFVYEGFLMNLDDYEAEQVTNFREHVTEPVFFHHTEKLMVTVDKQFAQSAPDYQYWEVSLDGHKQKRLHIEMPAE